MANADFAPEPESALLQLYRRQLKLFDEVCVAAKIGGWEVLVDSREIVWTDETYNIHEVSRATFTPTLETAINFYVAEWVPIITRLVNQGLETGEGYDTELELITGKQRRIWVRAVGRAEVNNGKVVRLYGAFQDISERKLREQFLRESEVERERLLRCESEARKLAEAAVSARDEFISIASHELRTPLTPLNMQIQTLIRDHDSGKFERLSGERRKEIFLMLQRQVVRLRRLVEDLLDLSRIRSGQFRLDREQIDLSALVRDVVSRFAEQIREAGAVVTISDGAAVQAYCDPLRIEQVITNLLVNALKYAPGKPIEITLATNDQCSTFSVRDHGVGIATAEQDLVFERFTRAGDAAVASGLGIGLFISKEIVQAHKGTITLTSSAGEGATFMVELPHAG